MSNKVVTKLAASTFAISLLAAPAAFAQSGSSTSGNSTSGNGTNASSTTNTQTAKSSGGAMQQSKVRDQLTKAGFQDVEILDASYLVRAQTSEGNTVLMVIDPPMAGASGQSSSSGTQKSKP